MFRRNMYTHPHTHLVFHVWQLPDTNFLELQATLKFDNDMKEHSGFLREVMLTEVYIKGAR